jgi:hypothetical protein
MKRIIVLSLFVVVCFCTYLYVQGQTNSVEATNVKFQYCSAKTSEAGLNKYWTIYDYGLGKKELDQSSGLPIQVANKLGNQGWELVSVVVQGKDVYFYFKKAIVLMK